MPAAAVSTRMASTCAAAVSLAVGACTVEAEAQRLAQRRRRGVDRDALDDRRVGCSTPCRASRSRRGRVHRAGCRFKRRTRKRAWALRSRTSSADTQMSRTPSRSSPLRLPCLSVCGSMTVAPMPNFSSSRAKARAAVSSSAVRLATHSTALGAFQSVGQRDLRRLVDLAVVFFLFELVGRRRLRRPRWISSATLAALAGSGPRPDRQASR